MSKTIIVTGASRGIGHEIVKIAEKKGHRVYSISRNIKALKDYSFKYPRQVDLANEDSIDKFSLEVKNDGVKVDALINNAGAFLNKPFEKISKKEFEYIFQVNVFGLSSITRKVLPIIDSKGHIVNITSMGGINGAAKFTGLSAYSSSKGAVNILTELLAEEYKEKGPSFNALAFGAVQTEMLEEAFPGLKAPISAKEIADFILDFSLQGQKFFNGKIIPVSSTTP
ncbi:short-chain dehydrogenase [Bacteroidetes bacterium SCGC AAA795-G10]|nr:short-chain dehydrogenase [Bacteroidetes bacterium SCGC AAA795-G10]